MTRSGRGSSFSKTGRGTTRVSTRSSLEAHMCIGCLYLLQIQLLCCPQHIHHLVGAEPKSALATLISWGGILPTGSGHTQRRRCQKSPGPPPPFSPGNSKTNMRTEHCTANAQGEGGVLHCGATEVDLACRTSLQNPSSTVDSGSGIPYESPNLYSESVAR